MDKGWNEEYLYNRVMEIANLISKCEDDEQKEELLNEKELYTMLYMMTIFQEGTVSHTDVTTSLFLSLYNEVRNPFTNGEWLRRVANIFTKKVHDLKRLEINNEFTDIKLKEILEIVSTFIEETFGPNHYQLFKQYFYDDTRFVLYDKSNSTSFTVFSMDGDCYIKLPKRENITLLSEMAHEFGHMIARRNNFKAPRSNLDEVESFSYEISILNYLITHNLYSEDAKKQLKNILGSMEVVFMARYYNNCYKLNQIKDPLKFDKRVEDLALLNKLQITKMDDLFNVLAATLENDNIQYLISLLLVINILDSEDFLTNYHFIIDNISKIPDKEIMKRVLVKKNPFDSYLKLRESLE